MVINRPAIGIDVAKDFCVYAAVSPNGTILLNPFKALNTKQGLFFALREIKKVEDAFGSKPAIVLESTGHFSQRIVHFFLKQELDVFLINPLISHSIKNSSVRKVKTDQVDAVDLAKLFFTQGLRNTYIPSEALANLKILSRTRFQLVEQRAGILNQLIAAIEQVAPLFPKVFEPSSLTALTLLTQFPAPAQWVKTSNHKAILQMLESLPRRGKDYAQKKFNALLDCAKDATFTGIELSANFRVIQIYADNLRFMDTQIKAIDDEINQWTEQLPEIALLKSIPGIGGTLAPLIVGEIGDIMRFTNAKQLVAYCGIDPTVRQSGNFVGTRNKVTKRGSPFLRKALYVAAITAIRKNPNGSLVNSVIHEYYKKKIESKPKKQALGAVMNKLLRIIFSVLKNKQPFCLITSEQQVALYQSLRKKAA
ncbi:IS110 family transposase [Sporomusa sphaeroides]|uniref:Transposase IS116/IS110/IS902 family protein n=1 Tax=Sporomusa sphaeroides DSM 2875 TaxID=1337886 RepID=A0ABM9W9Z8_9FIRM|nr:IS110 family transposase [Sporomusa sphaeroides]OLS54854.1 transposase IS116/IS110/IS902 family protein [Sporomusa sphaeroides DSM 2875]CVK21933.1 Transposase IS116/IS110/IS902 family protein [Sporomusa sphaeroides DSM 2875]